MYKSILILLIVLLSSCLDTIVESNRTISRIENIESSCRPKNGKYYYTVYVWLGTDYCHDFTFYSDNIYHIGDTITLTNLSKH